jgi:hypothetical protein
MRQRALHTHGVDPSHDPRCQQTPAVPSQPSCPGARHYPRRHCHLPPPRRRRRANVFTFPLGRDKARRLMVRCLIPPLSTVRATCTTPGAAPLVGLQGAPCSSCAPCSSSPGPSPWTAGAFAGSLGAQLPHGEGPSPAVLRLGAQLSWALPPMPLPTPVRTSGIALGARFPPRPCPAPASQGSRVPNAGRHRKAGGGVWLNAPSPLWGAPIFLPGRSRWTWSPRRCHPREEAGGPPWPTRRRASSTGCQHKPGMAGATWPGGLGPLPVMPQGMPQPSLPAWPLASSAGRLAGAGCAPGSVVCTAERPERRASLHTRRAADIPPWRLHGAPGWRGSHDLESYWPHWRKSRR